MNHMKIIYSLLFILLCSPIQAEDVFTTEDIYSLKDITLSIQPSIQIIPWSSKLNDVLPDIMIMSKATQDV